MFLLVKSHASQFLCTYLITYCECVLEFIYIFEHSARHGVHCVRRQGQEESEDRGPEGREDEERSLRCQGKERGVRHQRLQDPFGRAGQGSQEVVRSIPHTCSTRTDRRIIEMMPACPRIFMRQKTGP